MHFQGVIIGAAAFLLIGFFHPLVIWTEYHYSKSVWPAYFIGGSIALILSVITENVTLSAILAVAAFTAYWSIRELFEQERRVERGWFPKNPKRDKTAIRKQDE